MKPNPAQARAARDARNHVLVEAGAGTGKTQCVVARVLYALGEPVAGARLPPPERLALRDLAAITFTNVAAADLQRKLREALRAAGRGDDVHRVDTARIGTIHSFCGQILREFALQLRRSPATVGLDETESAALRAEAAREVMLAAIEGNDVEGLPALLAEFTVEEVQQWAARLAVDADRLNLLLRDPDASPRERVVLTLADRTLALVRGWLDERSALDFDSMVGLTRDLIRDRPDVRRVLQRRIRLLIIDEFQDVDPVQQEIAWLLGEPGTGRADPTRLMLVGDPKQSIFRFRRADVAVWTRVRREFEAGAGVVHTLTENFRSRRSILAFVDAVLGPELDAPVDPEGGWADFEVPAQPLTATVESDPGGGVELITLPPGDRGKARTGEDARVVEIPAVADYVAELVSAGTSPGDIAILLSAWGPAAGYREALTARGLASWTLRNEGYWERREVVDCLLALGVALDPLDDIALFGFLRSPMVAVRDETLLAVALQARVPYWHHLERVACVETELLVWAAGIARRLAGLRDRVPHDVLLEELLDETGYLAHLRLLDEDGRQAEANVGKLIRRLRRWRHLALREILRDIDELRERGDDTHEGDAPLGSRTDAVTITSIHSAKGLEWPVVIWADVTRGAASPDWRFLIGRDGVRLRDPDIDKPDDDPRFAAARRADGLEERAQRKRLWYVAATRAKERLVVAGLPLGQPTQRHAGTAAECVARMGALSAPGVEYRDHLGVEFEAGIRLARVASEAAPASDDLQPVLPASSLAAPRPPVQVLAGRVRHSASELLTFSRCPRKHWFTYVAGVREPPVDRTSPEFIDAVTRGHIVHDVLEHLREQDELDGLLEDAIGRWDPDAPPPEGAQGSRYRKALHDEVSQVASHPEYRAVADLPGARRELGFVHLLTEGRQLQGRIDLAGPRADGIVLLDVKTSGPMSVEAARRRAESYGPQRDVYVGAVEAVTGRPVAEFGFHFSRAGQQVVERVTGETRERSARAVEAGLARIEAGERGMTENRNECWFCGYRKAGWCEGTGTPLGR